MAGIYIHIPFCSRKCLYCGFYSVSNLFASTRLGGEFADRYVDALLKEFVLRRAEISEPVTTLYIGGGTPSLLPRLSLKRLVEGIETAVGGLAIEEFTIEANPEQINREELTVWKEMGINRVSIGVQSFSDDELKVCGRRHTASQAQNAVERAIEEMNNVSIDLIYGLPKQSFDSWAASVERAIELRPTHISAYALMYDEGTSFTKLLASGTLKETSEELLERMYSYLTDRLASAGYEHYEVSNFALPGFRSRHNSSYWIATPYLGLGAAAHSYDGLRTRRSNPEDVEAYVENFEMIRPNRFFNEEVLTDTELREEMILTRMRTCEGLSLKLYEMRFGTDALIILKNAAVSWIKRGAAEYSPDRSHLRLTASGVMLSDAVILSLTDF